MSPTHRSSYAPIISSHIPSRDMKDFSLNVGSDIWQNQNAWSPTDFDNHLGMRYDEKQWGSCYFSEPCEYQPSEKSLSSKTHLKPLHSMGQSIGRWLLKSLHNEPHPSDLTENRLCLGSAESHGFFGSFSSVFLNFTFDTKTVKQLYPEWEEKLCSLAAHMISAHFLATSCDKIQVFGLGSLYETLPPNKKKIYSLPNALIQLGLLDDLSPRTGLLEHDIYQFNSVDWWEFSWGAKTKKNLAYLEKKTSRIKKREEPYNQKSRPLQKGRLGSLFSLFSLLGRRR